MSRQNSDNGSEFINAHLLAYCEQEEQSFTRSRSGQSQAPTDPVTGQSTAGYAGILTRGNMVCSHSCLAR